MLVLLTRLARGGVSPRAAAGTGLTAALLLLPMASNAHFHDCEPDSSINFDEVHCWYGGLSFGQSRLAPEITADQWTLADESVNAVGVLVGYQFLPNWFAEFSFHDLGEARLDAPGVSEDSQPGLSYRVPSLMAGYNLADPLSTWNLFVKGGLAKIMNSSRGDEVDVETGSSVQLAIGAGVQLSFGPHWLLRLEAQSFDRDASVYGLTIVRRGGFMKW